MINVPSTGRGMGWNSREGREVMGRETKGGKWENGEGVCCVGGGRK